MSYKTKDNISVLDGNDLKVAFNAHRDQMEQIAKSIAKECQWCKLPAMESDKLCQKHYEYWEKHQRDE